MPPQEEAGAHPSLRVTTPTPHWATAAPLGL